MATAAAAAYKEVLDLATPDKYEKLKTTQKWGAWWRYKRAGLWSKPEGKAEALFQNFQNDFTQLDLTNEKAVNKLVKQYGAALGAAVHNAFKKDATQREAYLNAFVRKGDSSQGKDDEISRIVKLILGTGGPASSRFPEPAQALSKIGRSSASHTDVSRRASLPSPSEIKGAVAKPATTPLGLDSEGSSTMGLQNQSPSATGGSSSSPHPIPKPPEVTEEGSQKGLSPPPPPPPPPGGLPAAYKEGGLRSPPSTGTILDRTPEERLQGASEKGKEKKYSTDNKEDFFAALSKADPKFYPDCFFWLSTIFIDLDPKARDSLLTELFTHQKPAFPPVKLFPLLEVFALKYPETQEKIVELVVHDIQTVRGKGKWGNIPQIIEFYQEKPPLAEMYRNITRRLKELAAESPKPVESPKGKKKPDRNPVITDKTFSAELLWNKDLDLHQVKEDIDFEPSLKKLVTIWVFGEDFTEPKSRMVQVDPVSKQSKEETLSKEELETKKGVLIHELGLNPPQPQKTEVKEKERPRLSSAQAFIAALNKKVDEFEEGELEYIASELMRREQFKRGVLEGIGKEVRARLEPLLKTAAPRPAPQAAKKPQAPLPDLKTTEDFVQAIKEKKPLHLIAQQLENKRDLIPIILANKEVDSERMIAFKKQLTQRHLL
jgi:hypothetical protein